VTRILFFTVLAFFASIGFATAEDTVDTKQGLKYERPTGWVQSPAKKGTVSALKKSGDEKSQIEFRFAKIANDRAESYFTTFHNSLLKAKLERVGSGAAKKYGKLSGKLTEYKTGKGASAKSLFVYEFTTANGGAWLAVGMFDARSRDAYLKDYEVLLGSCAVE